MSIYRYIVTVDAPGIVDRTQMFLGEIDSNLDSVVLEYGIEHFTVEPLSQVYEPAFVTAPLSPDGRYNS